MRLTTPSPASPAAPAEPAAGWPPTAPSALRAAALAVSQAPSPIPLPPPWRERLAHWQRLAVLHEHFLGGQALSEEERRACRDVMLSLLEEEDRVVHEALPHFKTGLERDWLFGEADRIEAVRAALVRAGARAGRPLPSVLDRLTHHLRADAMDTMRQAYLRVEAGDLADQSGRTARLVLGLAAALRELVPSDAGDAWSASEQGACAAQQMEAVARLLQVQSARCRQVQAAMGRLLDLDALLRPYGLRHDQAAEYSRLLWAQRDALHRLQAGLRQGMTLAHRQDVPALTWKVRRAEADGLLTDLHASAQAIVTHWRELRQLHPTWGQRAAPATLH